MAAKRKESSSTAATPTSTTDEATGASRRAEMIATALTAIDKDLGRGVVTRMGSAAQMDIRTFPSGSLGVDCAIGVGGYPRGRIVEIYGPESVGKSTLCLLAAASIQKQGEVVLYVDAEHALNVEYAKRLGVNIDDLLICQPDHAEQALNVVDSILDTRACGLIIVDSVAALVPQKELEGEMGDATMGGQARLMGQALRKITAKAAHSGTTIIFINQLRMKLGVMFGNPETTTGGNALKFYASLRIDLRRSSDIKEGEQRVGVTIRAKIVKNKVAAPFKETEFSLRFDRGFSRGEELLDLGLDAKIIEKSGAWFSLPNLPQFAQGRAAAWQYIDAHPEIAASIEQQIRAMLFSQPQMGASPDDTEPAPQHHVVVAAPAIDAPVVPVGRLRVQAPVPIPRQRIVPPMSDMPQMHDGDESDD